jgi:WD40 repeat protein
MIFHEPRLCLGHQDSVTCLAYPQLPAGSDLFGSGSDDSTIRLWDLRTNRASRCIASCFDGKSIEGLCFSLSDQNMLYACAGRSVFTFDLRRDGVIVREARSSLTVGEEDNEINCLAVHHKEDVLAVGTDEGSVAIIPLNKDRVPQPTETMRVRTLSRYHSNLVSSISFKPSSARELISGGFDCNLYAWDYSVSRPQASFNFSTALQPASSTDSKNVSAAPPTNILNPPFVYVLQYMMSGRMVVAALGSGAVSEAIICVFHLC